MAKDPGVNFTPSDSTIGQGLTRSNIGGGKNSFILPGLGKIGQILTIDGSRAAAWAWGGKLVQVVYDEDSDYVTTDAVTPDDDTLPLYTEGFEVLSVNLTPKYSDSTIVIFVTIFTSHQSFGIDSSFTLFKDRIAKASRGIGGHTYSAHEMKQTPLIYSEASGDTKLHTWSIRIGTVSGTLQYNGQNSSGRYGSASKSALLVMEVAP